MNPSQPSSAPTTSDTEKIRTELRMDDGVKYRGRLYRVEGIDTKSERPVAVANPENGLDRGCIRFEDVGGIVVIGPRDVEQIAMASKVAFTQVMIGLVGKGESEDGVYVLSDEDGFADSDHDGHPVDVGSSDWNHLNSDARVAARREANRPNPNWWDGFAETDSSL